MKKFVIFAILLGSTIIGAIALGMSTNYLQISTLQPTPIVTPTIEPTGNLSATTQPTLKPTPVAPTATVVPKPSVLMVISPIENATYRTNVIELSYSIDSKVLWSYYTLDSSGYVTGVENLFKLNGLVPFKGNITLNLPEGQHRIMVAIQTEESRFSSVPIAYQTIYFIIGTPSSDST